MDHLNSLAVALFCHKTSVEKMYNYSDNFFDYLANLIAFCFRTSNAIKLADFFLD